MRTFPPVLIAAILGLSSAAFAATPAESAREARMAEALKDYRANKPVASTRPAVKATPVVHKHRAAKKHAKNHMKHHAKRTVKSNHAGNHKTHVASVKAASTTTR